MSKLKKKGGKKHNKIALLAKNCKEVLISKALFPSYISNDKFFSVNNVLKQNNDMKKTIKNP